ncbi:MAG: CPBP family intramembrane metalloprotease [Lachnospiraceae bacterium]|nr:CPBP family intramembrane metalloprotease [Lachnospiraceae bacterium]
MKKFVTILFSFTPFLISLGLQFVLIFYYMFLSAFIFPILSENGDIDLLWADINFNAIISVAWSVICVAFFGIWYYRTCGGQFKPEIKKNWHSLQLAGIVLMIPATQFATSLLIGIISSIFPKWLEDYEALMESAGMTGEIPLFMMIYSVCLAPISEELIFRGVTMRLALRAFPFWIANLIQAVLFGVFHMNMLQGCYAFALGLILGYVCEKGGSIYHSILFHFLFNLWGTTSTWMNSIDEGTMVFLILMGSFILLPVGLLLFHQGSLKKNPCLL